MIRLRNATDSTLMLDEATDEENHSEISLITRLVDGATVKNVFLDLLCLSQGDANSIFSAIHRYFERRISISPKQDSQQWTVAALCQVLKVELKFTLRLYLAIASMLIAKITIFHLQKPVGHKLL